MSHRNLEYLHRNRIVYRAYPENDKPTESYWWGNYYEDGTHECYELFKSKAKITTYKSLKWHLLVLLYLNPNIDEKKFKNLSEFICDKSNGFITFTVSERLLNKISDEVYKTELDEAPKNKLRKIIFKPNSGIDVGKKLRIVGSLIGKNKKANKRLEKALGYFVLAYKETPENLRTKCKFISKMEKNILHIKNSIIWCLDVSASTS